MFNRQASTNTVLTNSAISTRTNSNNETQQLFLYIFRHLDELGK